MDLWSQKCFVKLPWPCFQGFEWCNSWASQIISLPTTGEPLGFSPKVFLGFDGTRATVASLFFGALLSQQKRWFSIHSTGFVPGESWRLGLHGSHGRWRCQKFFLLAFSEVDILALMCFCWGWIFLGSENLKSKTDAQLKKKKNTHIFGGPSETRWLRQWILVRWSSFRRRTWRECCHVQQKTHQARLVLGHQLRLEHGKNSP